MRKPFIAAFLLLLAAIVPGQGINVQFKDLDGKKIELADLYKSRPLVVSFWATWCKPCLEELRHLQQLHQTYADSGVGFLAVSIDEPRDQGKVRSLVAGNRFSFPVALDPEQRGLRRLGFNDVPGTVILDGKGESVWRHFGYKLGDELKLEKEIRKLLIRPVADSTEPKTDMEEKAE